MKDPNYTEAQEAFIRAESLKGPLNADAAARIGEALGKSSRSVIAKVIRMQLPYERKVAVSKTGEPVTKKETLVAEIGAVVSGNLDGLEKAPKAALIALRNFVKG